MMKERDTKEMFVSLFRERAREREFRREIGRAHV